MLVVTPGVVMERRGQEVGLKIFQIYKNISTFSKYIYRGPVVAQLEAGTDLQILLRLPQLVGGGGGPGERGLPAGDGEDDHHEDQQQAEH